MARGDYEKLVAGACKPKRAAPKAKYIDPLVQSTFNNDGALQEIVRSLSLRLRDSNTTVVFKGLIVLHQLLRAGSLESTFSYLASSSLSTSLSAHEAPNIAAYGHYLAARIKSYSNLKRDVIRDKSDRRAKDRLRKLGVEQGLLRETREVQRMIAALVESKFYTDDVDDEVSMTALRFLVKDLLVLFTCVNEGVINVLEHYFEMSHPDATTALKIYKTFCRDTEKVVTYLGIAKKLQNVTHIQIPNLKHAPVSLVSSLEEYLNDPNFEKNREEYKENKRIADGGAPRSRSESAKPTSTAASASAAPSNSASTSASVSAPAVSGGPTSFTDFFESIEQSQTSMFDPSTNTPSLSYFQQQATFNPFLAPQATGINMGMMAFGQNQPQQANPFGMLQPQMTGFVQPQMTGFVQPQMTGVMPGGPFLQPQATGTINPFRQSMMMTGQGAINGSAPSPFSNALFQAPQQPQQTGPFGPIQPQTTGAFGSGGPFGNAQPTPSPLISKPQTSQNASGSNSPFAPASRIASPPPPVPSVPSPNNMPTALVPQKTGARNPFAPAPGTEIVSSAAAQQPQQQQTGPSLNAMRWQNAQQQQQQHQQQQHQQQQQPQQQQPSTFSGMPPSSTGFSSPFGQQQQQGQRSALGDSQQQQVQQSSSPVPLTQTKTGGLMASIASDFARTNGQTIGSGSGDQTSGPNGNNATASPFGTNSHSSAPFSSSSSAFGSTSAPPTSGFSSLSISTSNTGFGSGPSSASYLSPQRTGFGGSTMKPFQPTSSFGSQLADEFGSAGGGGGINNATNFNSSGSIFDNGNVGAGTMSQPQTSTSGLSSPLQAQSTGFGSGSPAFNPFRSGSVLPPLNGSLSAGLGSNGGSGLGQSQGHSAFGGGSKAFGAFGGGTVGHGHANGQGQAQQSGSLI